VEVGCCEWDGGVGVFGGEEGLGPEESKTGPAAKAVGEFPGVVVFCAERGVRCCADCEEDGEDDVREDCGSERYAARVCWFGELDAAKYD
jgi:hypothetical protein